MWLFSNVALLPLFKGGKIKKDGLHSSLENMGIKLSMEEFAEVTKNLETDGEQ